MFKLCSEYKASGDQPKAIKGLLKGLDAKKRDQVLLGVTGSGKTFSMAHVIAKHNKPTLIMAHNKTLAAQIYGEMKNFFPHNAVEYFVSYYDYYQPEAYIPRKDLYIEKDSSINEHIDLMRHSTTRSLFERRDVIIVASVSCIYGLGSPESYSAMTLELKKGMIIKRADVIKELVKIQYERNDIDFHRGHFRVRGDIIDIYPSHYIDRGWRVELFGDEIDQIQEFDMVTNKAISKLDSVKIYANSHYITPRHTIDRAVKEIQKELVDRVSYFESVGRVVDAHRLKQKTEYDIEMMVEMGSCKGIENYSRYLSGRQAGDPPPTLFEYMPKDSLLLIDESHVTVPQIGGMYNGDRARKNNLVEYGFRLPSALDNRPLKFEEWEQMRPQTIFVSATPGRYELEKTGGEYMEQIIRPTGLIDPLCDIRPIETQIDDFIHEARETIAKGYRVLATTLTKKMAERLTDYLQDLDIKVSYLHSEVNTLDRVSIIRDLRLGEIDIIVGVNLLREGLDIPECGLVVIFDADKEGFLRSETSLIQTIGRAARNVDGRVILYADKQTNSIKKAMSETDRRRNIQLEYNKKHGITPRSVKSSLNQILESPYEGDSKLVELNENKDEFTNYDDIHNKINNFRQKMLSYANDLEFEKSAKLRDEITKLEQMILDN